MATDKLRPPSASEKLTIKYSLTRHYSRYFSDHNNRTINTRINVDNRFRNRVIINVKYDAASCSPIERSYKRLLRYFIARLHNKYIAR